ncbi:MAG: Hsp70 family protein [Treponema sp.]|nr:Hsp70 family protein [Treponema sp.]
MKTIGIKLADGTFYPVLEEGAPKKRMLDLTTAKDNQTKVQIDLYRSESGTIEDAEYVDTLEVTKLNPHPNGEPELHLSVGLDENNNLTAEVVDPETGKKSETEVNLVSRTEAERAEAADFGVASAVVSEETVAENPTDATFAPEELPEMGTTALEDMPFSFDHSEPNAAGNPVSAPSSDNFEGELPDFSDLDDDIPVEDKTLESVDFNSDETVASDASQSDDIIGTESPDLSAPESSDATEDFSTEDFSLPDFDSDDTVSAVSEPADDSTVAADSDFASDLSSDLSSDLPDFGDDFGSNSSSDSADTPDTNDTTEVSEPKGFDLPDFDMPASDTSSVATGLNFDDLDDPAFTSSDDDLFATSGSTESNSGSAMDFSDLYDKETIAGEHASLYDEEEEKKTHTPMIICIICAIICVIATILLLFVVPSKYNLLASRNTNGVSLLDKFFHKESAVEKTVEEPKEETKFIDVVVEEPKNEAAPEAVEDKIIIAPEPEKVVPKPAPVEEKKPEVKKTSDVKYHIRWGDTLWDISESYYKTPWKYPKIADYNRIKNPDLIISGTDIMIPAE